MILLDGDIQQILDNASTLEESDISELGVQVDNLGGGAYHLVYKLGVYAVIIGLVIAGLKLVFSNAQNRQDAKSNILYTILGGVLIFAAVSIVIFLQTVGSGLFS